jgi:hypothetical protein
MALVPDGRQDKVTFFQTRIGPWTDHAAAIGTSPGAVADLSSLTSAAQAAIAARMSAESVFRAAVSAQDEAIEAMAAAGANIISAIRTKARTDGNGVYDLAQIPPVADRSRMAAPGQPTGFKATLQGNGSVTLTWTCKNPAGSQGTTYQVWRRLNGTGERTFLGVAGVKKFIDETIPAGTAYVTYLVQAFRSTRAGTWGTFDVNFTTTISGDAIGALTTRGTRQFAA